MRSLADRIIQYRYLIILFFLIITLVFTSKIPQVVIDTDLKS